MEIFATHGKSNGSLWKNQFISKQHLLLLSKNRICSTYNRGRQSSMLRQACYLNTKISCGTTLKILILYLNNFQMQICKVWKLRLLRCRYAKYAYQEAVLKVRINNKPDAFPKSMSVRFAAYKQEECVRCVCLTSFSFCLGNGSTHSLLCSNQASGGIFDSLGSICFKSRKAFQNYYNTLLNTHTHI